jgi:hypothetical protein
MARARAAVLYCVLLLLLGATPPCESLVVPPAVPPRSAGVRASSLPPPPLERLALTADVSVGRPVISWYPGHIARAERLMGEVLSMVDVVVELRDARVPASTAHPSLAAWIGSRGHVLAVNRVDSVPVRAVSAWRRALRGAGGPEPLFIDAKLGAGVDELRSAIVAAGAGVNARRKRRGINPRPVRAAILGYPNVGKSALINRLVGRVKTKSENRPGVTRGFAWVRIDSAVQLLDSPGILPAKQVCAAAPSPWIHLLARFPISSSGTYLRSSRRPRTTSLCVTTSARRHTMTSASPPRCSSGCSSSRRTAPRSLAPTRCGSGGARRPTAALRGRTTSKPLRDRASLATHSARRSRCSRSSAAGCSARSAWSSQSDVSQVGGFLL